jgi:predicted amidohydrolase
MSTDSLIVAAAQFEVVQDWRLNLDHARSLAAQAAALDARILLLPEGIISRDPADTDATAAGAQPLDGPFVTGLLEASSEHGVAVAGTVHVPTAEGRATNVLVVCDGGQLIAAYTKLHLYDAFASRESDRVDAGDQVPPLVDLDGWRLGLMTCYDVRFPELARAHAVAGADALLLPTAWVRGTLKEHHWDIMTRARALENGVFVIAAGELSARNIGGTMVIDPLGVPIAAVPGTTGLITATLHRERLSQVRSALPLLANLRFAPPVLAGLENPTKERN